MSWALKPDMHLLEIVLFSLYQKFEQKTWVQVFKKTQKLSFNSNIENTLFLNTNFKMDLTPPNLREKVVKHNYLAHGHPLCKIMSDRLWNFKGCGA